MEYTKANRPKVNCYLITQECVLPDDEKLGGALSEHDLKGQEVLDNLVFLSLSIDPTGEDCEMLRTMLHVGFKYDEIQDSIQRLQATT